MHVFTFFGTDGDMYIGTFASQDVFEPAELGPIFAVFRPDKVVVRLSDLFLVAVLVDPSDIFDVLPRTSPIWVVNREEGKCHVLSRLR